VLIKGGAHLENLGRLRALAFDKTGTLTQGKPAVTDTVAAEGGSLSADEVLALAAAVEVRSAHPLAQAVVRAAEARQLPLPAVRQVEAITGRGLRADHAGRPLLVGSLALLEEHAVAMPPAARRQVEALEAQGKTVMLVALDGRVAGMLALADPVRASAPPALARLKALGVRATVMLTGDNERVAAAVAGQAGLDRYRAGLMPEDKLAAVQSLAGEHGPVGMVGDGVNDAPALATAAVGIAMGGAGTDVALETADVALLSDDLSRLPYAIGLGRATRAVIIQNLVISLGVIALLVAASVAGWAGIGLAIAFHEGSTLVVVLNALRLLRYRQA